MEVKSVDDNGNPIPRPDQNPAFREYLAVPYDCPFGLDPPCRPKPIPLFRICVGLCREMIYGLTNYTHRERAQDGEGKTNMTVKRNQFHILTN